MWFEVLPPLIIITTFLAAPYHVTPYITKYFTGHAATRNERNFFERAMLSRDMHLTHKMNLYKGLECLPDE